jgi:hypothetical protein
MHGPNVWEVAPTLHRQKTYSDAPANSSQSDPLAWWRESAAVRVS